MELVKKTDIYLTRKGLRDGDLGVLAKVLRRSTALKTLWLGDNQIQLADETFTEALAASRTLRHLDLRNNKIDAAGVGQLARALAANNSLVRILLEGNQITLSDDRFTDALAGNRTLKLLNLAANKIDAAGAERLATALKANDTLLRISLRNNQISDQGAKSIADALGFNKSLEIVHLGENSIKDEGSKSLANSLLKNGTLCWMSLDKNKIGDMDAQNLATSLLVNRSLRTLSLKGNAIGDEGAESLADALDSNHALEQLCLEANPITNIVVTDNIDAMLADPNRKKQNEQMSTLDQLQRFRAKKNAEVASLKSDLANPMKQLETMLASKDAQIAALEAGRKNSLPIVETLDPTDDREAKRPRTRKHAVVERAALREQDRKFLRVKREKSDAATAADGA